MQRLINIRTNLSDYKNASYGYDRRGAGPLNTNASGQPYEITPIPKRSFNASDFEGSNGPATSEDFLLRGGTLLPEILAKDVSRLAKMFTDLKSSNGLLFTAKQEVLSRTGVNILATNNGNPKSKNRRALNNGIYLPTSTLAQAAANPFGSHLLKQGIDPTASTGPDGGILGGVLNDLFGLNIQDPLGNPTYFSTVAYSERRGGNETSSRLVSFTKFNVNENTNSENELYNYSGGPGSILGVGKTSIKMLDDQRTGINNSELRNSNFFTTGKTLDTNFGFDYSVFRGGTTNSNFESFRGGTYFGNIYSSGSKTVTGKYSSQTNTPLLNLLGIKGDTFVTSNNNLNGAKISSVGQSVFQPNTFQAQASNVVSGLGSSLDYSQLMDAKGANDVVLGSPNNEYPQAQILEDFRKKTSKTAAPSYTTGSNRLETRTNSGNPGYKNTSKSYVTGNISSKKGLDKINALQIYKTSKVTEDPIKNDLCKFRIGVIDNDTPSLKTFIHFRALLDSMGDSYTANWSSQKFAGRAENLYNYQGFDRQFDLSWTIYAQSKQELIPMYQKLNYLASVCAPDYSADGYMRGNLISLTVGGYLYEQIGIMKGITYTVPMESPWEIAINDTNAGPDKNVKELPFMIKVSGFGFTPIHDFVPSIQKNDFNKDTDAGKGKLTEFGEQRYIALSNGFNQNYSPSGKSITIPQPSETSTN